MNRKIIKKLLELTGLLIFPVLGFIYGWLNMNHQDAQIISTKLDSYIPFLPIFIIPYIVWYAYVFGYLLYFWWKDSAVYWKSLAAILVGEAICFFIYYVFQTTVPRPQLEGDGILIDLVSVIYMNDQPVNCFPSIHVLTTSVVMFFSLQIKGYHAIHKYLTHIVGILIILSTLFVKQHVLYDVAASLLLSITLYGCFFLFKAPAWQLERRPERKKREEYQTF
ncbi:phosphatase PAP2 family protein [Peribacillus sp. SCS-155]|uniref:phosphatase PAP2 family protein n=1 Tax=Peribacillus sedimenti TaxID=3115297 RepID=UPI003905F8C5